MTLEHELSLTVGVEYLPGKVDKIQTKNSIEHTVRQLQTCLNSLKSTPSSNGIIQNCKCTSMDSLNSDMYDSDQFASLLPCSNCKEKNGCNPSQQWFSSTIHTVRENCCRKETHVQKHICRKSLSMFGIV